MLLSALTAILRVDAARQFQVGGDPAWPQNAPSTIAAKRELNLPARTPAGNVPTRLMQNGKFGAENANGISSGRRRDAWVRKDSVDHFEETDEVAGTAFIGSSVPYEATVQNGSRAHVITPRDGKVLAFMGASGNVQFARSVNHPGSAARPVRVSQAVIAQARQRVQDFFSAQG